MTSIDENRTPTPRMLYLACPYADEDPVVRARRMHAVDVVLQRAVEAGVCVYSPLNHLDRISTRPYRRYYRHGLQMLRRADAVVVVKLEGWQSSTGVQLEIRAAERFGLEVIYLDDYWVRTDWPRPRHIADGLRRVLRYFATRSRLWSDTPAW